MSLKGLSKMIDTVVEQARTDGKELFVQESKALFDRFPEMESFGWKQYTVYWNDGEALYFTVLNYPESVYINGEQEDSKFEKAQDSVSTLLSDIDAGLMETIFGDHTHVTVLRNGIIKQEDYTDHD